MTVSMGVVELRQDILAPGLATFLLVCMCYIAGRVHQYFKQTTEREQAFREGYNLATKSLFSLAAKTAKLGGEPEPVTGVAKQPKPKPMRGFATVPGERHPLPARHRAQGTRKPNLSDTIVATPQRQVRSAA